MRDKDINSLDHTTWKCQYHIVFAPKFRRQIIYKEIKVDIGKILRQLCQQKGVEIIEAELCPDHVHMLLCLISAFSLSGIQTVSANSVIHYHAVFYQALKYAMKTGLVTQNVAMKVDRPKKNDFQPVFLDASQLAKLFEAVKGTKLELIVLVAAFYGLRRGEVLGLKWDAIDFERGTITIKRTVTTAMIDGKETIIEQNSAKTKSSLRTLPLVGSFRRYFEEVKAAQSRNKEICGNSYNYAHDGYVFVDEMGDRIKPNWLTVTFPDFVEKHGLPRMRFHDLCHTYSTIFTLLQQVL